VGEGGGFVRTNRTPGYGPAIFASVVVEVKTRVVNIFDWDYTWGTEETEVKVLWTLKLQAQTRVSRKSARKQRKFATEL